MKEYFLLTSGCDYESTFIHGLYSSRAFAELQQEEITQRYDWWEIIPLKLDASVFHALRVCEDG